MTLEELTKLAAGGESERLELKKSTAELEAAFRTLCGFLNGEGGTVLVGVRQDGTPLGQEVSDDTQKAIASHLAKLEPTAAVRVSLVPVVGKRVVIAFETTDRSHGPYAYGFRAFQRFMSTTSAMPQIEYQRRLLRRSHPQYRWENQLAEGYGLDRLDMTEVQRTLSDAVVAGRLESQTINPAEVLDRLKLVQGGRPLLAAIVAFATEMLPDFPQCKLRLARFRGVTKTEFIDQQQLTGHAFRLLREADLFLRRHLPVAGRFEPGVFERKDEPLFPTLALREALVNALCHRDYSIPGGSIGIAIFDDRLEISSTGLLPAGLTIADLKRTHQSQPRNPLLAEVFFKRGLIEGWGRGTQKIVELCVKAGHPEPEFEERSGEVIVRFNASGYVPPHRVEHDLSDRQRRILHVLRDGVRFRSAEILERMMPKPSPTVLRDDLNFLRSCGLVEGSGRGVGARWWLRPV